MRLNPAVPRTLPGVRFEVPAQPTESSMPRMDIALFVGFASSGPLQAAVAVESLKEFETVFGVGLQLAVEASSGAAVQGLLHPAVRGFFSQGGQRCWVLRVAGAGALSSQFPLPCLLTAQRTEPNAAWQLAPAILLARSPGSGADTAQVAARVTQSPVRMRAVNASTLQITHTANSALRAGDVLRLDFADLRLHVRVERVRSNTLQLGGIVGLLPIQGNALPITLGDRPLSAAQWLGTGRLAVTVRMQPQDLPQRSQVVSLAFGSPPREAWMALQTVDITDAQGQDGFIEATLSGTPWCLAQPNDLKPFNNWCDGGGERLVQRLRLDLQTQAIADQAVRLTDLNLASSSVPGLAPGVFNLPTDEQVFALDSRAISVNTDAALVAQRDAQGHLQNRFALASPSSTVECLMLPLADMDVFDAVLNALPSSQSTLERDGLTQFDWTLFAEPTLAQLSADLLANQAEALRCMGGVGSIGRTPAPLRGMHAAFGAWPAHFSDEPTLLVVPDAIHPGWEAIAQPAAPWTELAPLPEPLDPCAAEPFRDCAAEPLPRPRFVRGADPRSDGSFTLFWTPVVAGATYTLEEALEPGFGSVAEVYDGQANRWDAGPHKTGEAFYRVRATLGRRTSPWSAPVRIVIGANGYETLPWTDDNLLAIHRLMLRTAAGRGDMLALLALPIAFDTTEATRYAARLCSTRADMATDPHEPPAPPAIGEQETRALSHGALHHPWLMLRREQNAIWFPPDGPVCGQLAAGALERGAWIAVANRPLRDCVALSSPGLRPSLADRQQLLDAQVNLLRSAPIGFVVSSSDTLAVEPDWRPINVRRLMCLLRRLALQRGQTYVFEPNGAILKRTVERGFEAVLDQLYRRGALAGTTPERAYQINVGPDINSRQRRDAGQFWVELKVAPSLPMSFLTVRLMRSGERVVSQEAH